MERAFKLNKESDYVKRLHQCKEYDKQQRDFIVRFFEEHGIESTYFKMGGNGGVNCPFKEYEKKSISLYISDDSDLEKFSNMLCKPVYYGDKKMLQFKKNSKIAKEFTDRCIEEQIIINIHKPSPRDYFENLWSGYSYTQLEYEDILYLKIDSNNLSENELPEGFEEIKISEFYKIMEEYDESDK